MEILFYLYILPAILSACSIIYTNRVLASRNPDYYAPIKIFFIFTLCPILNWISPFILMYGIVDTKYGIYGKFKDFVEKTNNDA